MKRSFGAVGGHSSYRAEKQAEQRSLGGMTGRARTRPSHKMLDGSIGDEWDH